MILEMHGLLRRTTVTDASEYSFFSPFPSSIVKRYLNVSFDQFSTSIDLGVYFIPVVARPNLSVVSAISISPFSGCSMNFISNGTDSLESLDRTGMTKGSIFLSALYSSSTHFTP